MGNPVSLLKVILMSMFIAIPISWFAMNKWLQDFAYRIFPGWWVFAASVMIALLVAFVTLDFQAIRAARTNPVKSLRSE